MKIYLSAFFGTGTVQAYLLEYAKQTMPKIYIASTVHNDWIHYPAKKRNMKIYLAGTYSREYVLAEAMKQFFIDNKIQPYILESFFYIREKEEVFNAIRPHLKGFLLDSGAFTYMTGNGGKCNWEQYIREYANFITRNNVDLFFELDIDSIVGIKEVERLRKLLETLTGKQCIPVWHKSRGLEYWKRLVKEYKYVAIGGIVTKEIKKSEHGIFTHLLKIAQEHGTKVHGLGYTQLQGMKKYPFYSVDSTSWVYGNVSGFVYRFTGNDLEKISMKNKRVIPRETAIHNFMQWVKYSQYADTNL